MPKKTKEPTRLGRPPIHTEAMQRHEVSLTARQAKYLMFAGEGSLSRGARRVATFAGKNADDRTLLNDCGD